MVDARLRRSSIRFSESAVEILGLAVYNERVSRGRELFAAAEAAARELEEGFAPERRPEERRRQSFIQALCEMVTPPLVCQAAFYADCRLVAASRKFR